MSSRAKRAEEYSLQALTASVHGNHEKAETLLKEACKLEPEAGVLWYNLGIEYLATNKPEAALNAFTKAESLGERTAELYNNMGLAWYNLQNYEQAEQCYSQSLLVNPAFPEALNNFGVLNFVQGNYKEARHFFEQAVAYNPAYQDALINLRDTYETLGLKDLAQKIATQIDL